MDNIDHIEIRNGFKISIYRNMIQVVQAWGFGSLKKRY